MLNFDLSPPRVEKRYRVKCLSTNTDCLPNKINEIEPFLKCNDIDIAAFTEILPKNCADKDFSNNAIHLTDYTCLSNFDGRGVCMYISNKFEVLERLNDIELLFTPSIFCKIKLSSNDILTFGAVYRSPSSSVEESISLNNQIDKISKKLMSSGEKLVIVGDFNYPDISWEDENSNKPHDHPSSLFLDIVQSNYLTQFIDKPTHFRALQNPTLIDLIFSNNHDFVSNIEYHPPFGKSHHSAICFSIDVCHEKIGKSPVSKFAVNRGKYDDMRQHFQDTDWDALLGDSDINVAWNNFESSVIDAMNIFIPKTNNKIFNKHTFYAPPTLLSKVQRKREAFKIYKQFPSNTNWNIYCKYRNQVKWYSRKAKINKEQKIAKESKLNPKMFYKYVNNKIKPTEKVSSLLKEDGKLTTSDSEKSEVLNDFFGSVFTIEDKSNIPVFKPCKPIDSFVNNVNITVDDMCNALSSLKINKSPGPDGLHPRVLKELCNEFSYPLKILFDRTVQTGKIPEKWKVAEVRPIFKKGNKTQPGNYRPVSLTSIVCKVFEGFVRNVLMSHLIDNNLLAPEQYGFCGGRSCTTQLLNTINDWLSFLDNNIPVDAVYLDFRKAFDTVPHERLISKLSGYGIQGNLLQWIRDFLSDRSQYVTINNNSSDTIPVSSGVPQGSVLGPTLFIYFINDMPDVVATLLKIFADDTKTYQPISSIKDHDKLQEAIDELVKWSEKWLLKFNGSKCKVLHLGKNNPMYKYTINDDGVIKELEVTDNEKDLGVNIDPLLNFDNHVNITVKKARQISGLIVKSITFKSKDTMIPLFKSLVRQPMEHAHAVWNPYKKKHIKLLESIQRHFTRYIIGTNNLSYEERMEFLKLPSLEYRRFRGDLIEVYKICHNLYDPITTKSLLTLNNSNTRNHNYKIVKPRVNSTQFLRFFTNRVVNTWNNLPKEAVNAGSLNIFKNCVDKYFKELMYSTSIEIA